MADLFRKTESELSQALLLRLGAELASAIVESPRTRRAVERFAAALLAASSAAELEQRADVVRIGGTGGK